MKLFVLSALLILGHLSLAQKKEHPKAAETKPLIESSLLNSITMRGIGPALTSGRVVDIDVNLSNKSEYYLATAASGVWKTTNAGVTFEPIFDGEASYSTGCVTIDQRNPNVVWVGSGENNSQRVAAYGDGVYKSEDGGKSWKNVGLKTSEHIGMITIDPRNSDIVFVAAYGPLWSAGGERGIYKTEDGGKTWKQVLFVSEHTGFNEVHIDPQNPTIMYATAHQRRRHEWTNIGGGPESGLYKSTDSGTTWNKITSGLPSVDIGRIGLAISPVNPNYVFAIVEAAEGKGGVFRSTDRGASWEKRNGLTTTGLYYQEIICDPKNIDKVYVPNVFNMTSDDGGKTFRRLGEKSKHVDNHDIWVDPDDTRHIITACDGGVYESYDGASNWRFFSHLPLTQFYKVEVDNAVPFYNVYGGTQDNNSMGGPSRKTSTHGIMNSDWFITQEGDGFESQIDPTDPNIVYVQSQYGGLVRYDKKSGEKFFIQPQPKENESGYRWNWDAPLVLSKHKSTRIYFAANKVFRSDDRGNTWETISQDLSKGIDRNKLPVMGKVWSMDAVGKNASTSIYGNIISLSESPLNENVLVAGTDDGLIHVTTNGGGSWAKYDKFPGVPEQALVKLTLNSKHNANRIYSVFLNQRNGDFKPYVAVSNDLGKTWTAIQNNLPARGSVYCIVEDHVNENLLFVGTEFGLYFSVNGGNEWIRLKGGLPEAINIRDLAIQERENDLVMATFGRGFYIFEDYSFLRNLTKDAITKDAEIYPVKDALMFIESAQYGLGSKSFQGESFYTAPNPPVGAVFTYYLKDNIKKLKELRQEKEKERAKKGLPIYYPSADSIRLEDAQPDPFLLFTISDNNGNVVRRLKTPAKKGINRIVWNLRTASSNPVNLNPVDDPADPYDDPSPGNLVMPGKYQVALYKMVDGKLAQLTQPRDFEVKLLNTQTLPATDKRALDEFLNKVSALNRAITSANSYRGEMNSRIRHLQQAIVESKVDFRMMESLQILEKSLQSVNIKLNGDESLTRRQFETSPSISERVGLILYPMLSSTSAPSETSKESYNIAAKQFEEVLQELRKLASDLSAVELALEKAGAPYTPGRLPEWKEN